MRSFYLAIVLLITTSLFGYFYSVKQISLADIQNQQQNIQVADYSSEVDLAPYGRIDNLKTKFVTQFQEEMNSEGLLDSVKLQNLFQKYNLDYSSKLTHQDDPIDVFLSLLPKNYRRHYSLVHRSYSIQKATPESPRVIMFGPNAQIMMSFNSSSLENKTKIDGSDTIEVIEWDNLNKKWNFSEISFDQDNKLKQLKNPPKCIMCHAGTPKPVDFNNSAAYQDKLKPIFPQYPFWPGFYGSVNDIVGVNTANSKDTVMLNIQDTLSQIKGLTFAETEELFRLRQFLDTNPKYLEIVKSEQEIHLKYFQKFIDSSVSRNRYRQLVSLKDLFTQKNEPIPDYLKSAPFRRTFDKEYGHYLLRPNFYLSSLMTFYQAQFVAHQILNSPVFENMKFSFLARKFNCGEIKVDGFSLQQLDASFDLVYPNLSSSESRDKQFLLAYQYNLEAQAKNRKPALPLFAWNLEANEDVASYHYGNVYADLNEIVLWNLARSLFPQIKPENGRSAAEERHYILPDKQIIKNFIDASQGYVSRMSQKNIDFASSLQFYSGSQVKFKAQPVSMYCDSLFIPAAQIELKKLALLKTQNLLPHKQYSLDERLYKLEDILPKNMKSGGLSMIKQACESCHLSASKGEDFLIKPTLNVDWYSESYHKDLHQKFLRSSSLFLGQESTLKEAIDQVLNEKTLPVPFENAMPYGRRMMSSFSLLCENLIIKKASSANRFLNFKEIFNCSKDDPRVDQNSLDCRCKKLILRKDKLFTEFFAR